MNNYFLKPNKEIIKQSFLLENSDGKVIYEAKMLKFKIFSDSPFGVINYITNQTFEHKIGKTIIIEENNGKDLISVLSKKSYFKYDGVKIWDYLHDLGIRIESNISNNKIGMTYTVSLEGKEIAKIQSSSPKGKSLITTNYYYDVTCDEKDLDIVFLVAFSIARTDQIAYN